MIGQMSGLELFRSVANWAPIESNYRGMMACSLARTRIALGEGETAEKLRRVFQPRLWSMVLSFSFYSDIYSAATETADRNQ